MPRKPEKTIEIVVAPDGSTTIEAQGFLGKGCKAATAPYEAAAGVVIEDKDKPEIRQTEARSTVDRTVKPGQ